MTRETTISARVPIDLATDVDALVVAERARNPEATRSTILRRLIRAAVDHELAHGRTTRRGSLFDPQPGSARNGDPATSRAAASRVAPRIGSQRRRALEAIAIAGGHGMTTDEVLRRLEQDAEAAGVRAPAQNSVARRVTDLYQAGAIRPSYDHLGPPGFNHRRARTRPTRHGSDAIVYVVTQRGLDWLQEATTT